METFLVVGLGNPGSRYANTRHNAGTDFVHMLCEKYGVELTEKKKYKASIGKFLLKDMEVILPIPTLFMNQSGKSVAPTVKGENIKLKNLLVVHDDRNFSFQVGLKIDKLIQFLYHSMLHFQRFHPLCKN